MTAALSLGLVSAPAIAAPDLPLNLGSEQLIGIVAGLWLLGASWAVVRAASWAMKARQAEARNARLVSLIGASPAAYLLLSRNGSAVGSSELPALLDVPEAQHLSHLRSWTQKYDAEDVDALTNDIQSLPVSGRAFVRMLHGRDGRVIKAEGRLPTSELVGDEGVIVWFSDITTIETERSELSRRTEQMTSALSALSALIEAAPFPIWHRSRDLNLQLVNAAYVRGVEAVSASDAVARGAELFAAGWGQSPKECAETALRSNEVQVRATPAIVAGERRMFRTYDVPLGEAGVAGFAFDIEDLEQTRAELGRFSRVQRDTLDRLSAGVAQFSADRTLVFFNLPFARLFALEPEWLGERPEFDRVLERMRESRRLPEQRDFPSWRNERREWFTTAIDPIEESWQLPEGSHLRVLIQPHPDGGLLVIFEDRTEQFRLASSRDTLLRVQAATLDNLFEAVCVFAANGRLQLWNAGFAKMWGVSPERLRDHSGIDDLVAIAANALAVPKRAELLRYFVRSATTDRRQRTGRFALRDGRHLEFAAVPLPDGNALFTMLDITDSRRIETALRERNDALEAADRLKSTFVANMSYELRTPLTSILGFSEMLTGGYAGPLSIQQTEYMASILDAAAKLQTLIDTILDLTISEAGGIELTLEPIDVPTLIQDVVGDEMALADAKGLDVTTDIRPGTGMIEGDQSRLSAAVRHIVGNAINFTPDGGRIMVLAEGRGDAVAITVSDSGIGIAPEEQQRVFNPFTRGGEEGIGSSVGGLGLALVRRYVTLHGGRVDLVSEPGSGTTVTLTIPRRVLSQ